MNSGNHGAGIRTAGANGISLAFEVFGRRGAPPVLLIMGLGTQMVVWDGDFCRLLADRGLRVVRFDNRDVGLSTRFDEAGVPVFSSAAPPIPVYTLADMAADVAGLMDALGFEAAHLVGLSMGGMIGQEAAVDFPDRVASLVSLMSTTGNPALPPPTPEAAEILMTPFPTHRSGFVASFANAYRVLAGSGFAVDPDRVRKWAEESFERGLSPGGVARQYAAILAAGDRRARLSRISAPTLVLHGEVDPLLRVECGIDTAAAIPGAEFEALPGMGHCLPEALWPRLADRIAMHVRRHAGARNLGRSPDER